MKNFLIKLHQWALSHPTQTRALHAIWQSILAYIIVTAPNIHTSRDIKLAAGGLVAAGLSTAKNQLWPIIVSWASSTDSHITPPTDFISPRTQ